MALLAVFVLGGWSSRAGESLCDSVTFNQTYAEADCTRNAARVCEVSFNSTRYTIPIVRPTACDEWCSDQRLPPSANGGLLTPVPLLCNGSFDDINGTCLRGPERPCNSTVPHGLICLCVPPLGWIAQPTLGPAAAPSQSPTSAPSTTVAPSQSPTSAPSSTLCAFMNLTTDPGVLEVCRGTANSCQVSALGSSAVDDCHDWCRQRSVQGYTVRCTGAYTPASSQDNSRCTRLRGRGCGSDFGNQHGMICECSVPQGWTVPPTESPTATPTSSPTSIPTAAPGHMPTTTPTVAPTVGPTASPTTSLTIGPTADPTARPTAPTSTPSNAPTHTPSSTPTSVPSPVPSTRPSSVAAPTAVPTQLLFAPTVSPTAVPTPLPTVAPAHVPTLRVSTRPTVIATTVSGAPTPTTAAPTGPPSSIRPGAPTAIATPPTTAAPASLAASTTPPESAGDSSSTLIIIVVIVLLVLGVGVGTAIHRRRKSAETSTAGLASGAGSSIVMTTNPTFIDAVVAAELSEADRSAVVLAPALGGDENYSDPVHKVVYSAEPPPRAVGPGVGGASSSIDSHGSLMLVRGRARPVSTVSSTAIDYAQPDHEAINGSPQGNAHVADLRGPPKYENVAAPAVYAVSTQNYAAAIVPTASSDAYSHLEPRTRAGNTYEVPHDVLTQSESGASCVFISQQGATFMIPIEGASAPPASVVYARSGPSQEDHLSVPADHMC